MCRLCVPTGGRHIMADLYPQYNPSALTLGSVFTLLPVAHKYNFTNLLERLVAFVKDKSGALSHNPEYLAERLQLDDLLGVCLARLRTMTREELQMAITALA
jgi:hypothetical protein